MNCPKCDTQMQRDVRASSKKIDIWQCPYWDCRQVKRVSIPDKDEQIKQFQAELNKKTQDWINATNLISKNDTKIKALQAELDEYHDAEKFVNDPPHDQECCGCVAILRKQKTQLQAELEEMKEFRMIACKMYPKRMVIVIGTCEHIKEHRQALKGGG